ncbi:hypothetical protein FSP39_008235 [Pinctada imbricata]|uniref:Integrase catalytic domain-containing protein n=1 Tax=Pinctada imbricata TaxID=66713 RepID=A0AA89C362_PINIB|nr:hypothetical protein FSP39_008235 [Pinctada imbricata]
MQKVIYYTRYGKWYELKSTEDDDIDMLELSSMRAVRDELTVHSDNILLRNNRIILPYSLRERAINIAHEGHQGISKTKSFLRSKVWFPNMDGIIEDAIRNCAACQVTTPENKSMTPLKMSELPNGPWENIRIDFCGPLPSGEYLFVIVDEYSRYPIVEIVRSVSARATIPVLDKVISMFGILKIVKSDNGSPFQSHEFKLFAENMGFTHRRITPRWPRANAQAESFNKPLMKAIRSAYISQRNWKQEMYKFLCQYRATPHTTTGHTPYSLLFMREPKTKLPQVSGRSMNTGINEQIRICDSQAKMVMKQNADRKNQAKASDIKIGDTVVLRKENLGNKLTTAYVPQPKVVTKEKGVMITVDDGTTRNVSCCKKISHDVKNKLEKSNFSAPEEEEVNWPTVDVTNQTDTKPIEPSNVGITSPKDTVRRSGRVRKKPSKLSDYVCSIYSEIGHNKP